MNIAFCVPGEPKGKARPKVTRLKNGFSHTYTPDKTVAYEELIRLRYLDAADGFHFEAGRPLQMRVVAFFKIPESKPKKTKMAMMLQKIRPTKKPDYDNISKIICDALNGLAYADDAQIVDARVIKLFAADDNPRVEIEISEIGGEPA